MAAAKQHEHEASHPSDVQFAPYSEGEGAKPGVVITQPVPMVTNFGNAPVPPGLEYLAQLNRLDVHQVLHLEEVLLGWERNNQYQICNEQNQEFLHVKEDTDCCTRQFCGNMRPFDIYVNNMQGQAVIQLHRDLRCQGVCCCCCLQEMEIMYPPGNVIARIKEKWSCTPQFDVVDTSGNVIYKITGPCCWCMPCTEIPFEIFRSDDQPAGNITKHWGGCRELFGQVNDFSLAFEPGEQPLNKAILLGATFLIDFMYFEHKQK